MESKLIERDARKIVCDHCGHKQMTKSESEKITCSSCQRKTRIKPKKDMKNVKKSTSND